MDDDVSTLLEILVTYANKFNVPLVDRWFQPFLRFWIIVHVAHLYYVAYMFQPFLRFYDILRIRQPDVLSSRYGFQPFLRFYRPRLWFLWVFKLFFGFL